jgi:protein Tex
MTSRRRSWNKDWGMFSRKLFLKLVCLTFPTLLMSERVVGVDANTASQHVLSYASGINKSQAAAIVAHREAHGPFRSREEIQKVKGIGKVSFQNAAGFLRIMNGAEPLDSTIVHPEKYSVLKSLLSLLSSSSPPLPSSSPLPLPPPLSSTVPSKKRKKPSDLSSSGEAVRQLSNEEIKLLLFSQQLKDYFLHCNWTDLSVQLSEDVNTLRMLSRWITDPLFNSSHDLDLRGRKGIPPVLARKCLLSPEDYQPGLIVQGIVRNITSFGTFLDIGAEEDGFLHRSKYGSRNLGGFVIGEIVQCRVLLIDRDRGGKISLGLAEEGDRNTTAAAAPMDGEGGGVLASTVREESLGESNSNSEQPVAKRSRRTKS